MGVPRVLCIEGDFCACEFIAAVFIAELLLRRNLQRILKEINITQLDAGHG